MKNTLHNLTLILENDPNLKGVVFNQLLDGMEIKGEVPWKHPSKFWRDADDAQLISYVDAHYGTFSARNYDIAVTKVADDRAYHPIREFIESLPEWDKVPRVGHLAGGLSGRRRHRIRSGGDPEDPLRRHQPGTASGLQVRLHAGAQRPPGLWVRAPSSQSWPESGFSDSFEPG